MMYILILIRFIIVINDGRVVEKGPFEELINKQGYFYSLYYLQNKY